MEASINRSFTRTPCDKIGPKNPQRVFFNSCLRTSAQWYHEIQPESNLKRRHAWNKHGVMRAYACNPAWSPMNKSWSPGFDPESAYCQYVAELGDLVLVFFQQIP